MPGEGCGYAPTDSASQRAVRSSRPSPWRGPTGCAPSGGPFGGLEERQAHRGQAQHRPQRAEGRLPGGLEPGRRGPVHRGRQDRVVALLEQLGERGQERARRGPRGQVLGRRHLVPGLDARASVADRRSRPVSPSRRRLTATSESSITACHRASSSAPRSARTLPAPAEMLDHLAEGAWASSAIRSHRPRRKNPKRGSMGGRLHRQRPIGAPPPRMRVGIALVVARDGPPGSRATISIVRPKSPTWSRLRESWNIPCRETSPWVGLRP